MPMPSSWWNWHRPATGAIRSLDFILAAAYAESGQSDEAKRAVERARLNNPYFDLVSFGSRFQDPALQRRLQESLRKAGLN